MTAEINEYMIYHANESWFEHKGCGGKIENIVNKTSIVFPENIVDNGITYHLIHSSTDTVTKICLRCGKKFCGSIPQAMYIAEFSENGIVKTKYIFRDKK